MLKAVGHLLHVSQLRDPEVGAFATSVPANWGRTWRLFCRTDACGFRLHFTAKPPSTWGERSTMPGFQMNQTPEAGTSHHCQRQAFEASVPVLL